MVNKKYKHKSGQAMLVLVIITMVTALGIGAAVATKSIVSNRATSYDEQSESAFSAADAGVELAIKNIKDAGGTSPIFNESYNLEGAVANYQLTDIGNKPGSVVIPVIDLTKDQIEVFRLDRKVDSIDIVFNGLNTVSMQVNLYIKNGQSNYTLKQEYYNCGSVSQPSNGVAATIGADGCIANISSVDAYDLVAISPKGGDSPQVSVTLNPGLDNVPLQGYMIDATGTSGQSHRTIKVMYLLPHLARVVNYTIYAESIESN